MKIHMGTQGQLGDLVINLVACRALKEQCPNCRITQGINKKYASAAPLFYHNPLIDDFVIWDGYDDFPTEKDKAWMAEHKFDLFLHPCPRNKDEHWWLKMHHTEANCLNHGITPPKDLQCRLTRWFELLPEYKDFVAITPFTSAGEPRDIPETVSLKIIDHIHSLGLKTIQLGLKTHKQLPTTLPIPGGTVFEDARIALSCRALVTADTGMNYIMSGYEHKVLGLYSLNCYPVAVPLKNRAPWNKNAIFLEGVRVSDIPEYSIYNAVNYLVA